MIIVPALAFGAWLITLAAPGLGESSPKPGSLDPYAGIYKLDSNDVVSIAKLDLGDGQKRLLLTEFKSGIVRILSLTSGDRFSAGTGFLVNSPVEIQLTFSKDKRIEVSSFAWQQPGLADRIAHKMNVNQEEVTFKNGEVRLAGRLTSPAGRSSNAAVIFLHGSGALDRYSFGPFPDFFLSHGFSVLVYDKRGTGASTGNLELSTLDDLARDGQAAVRFLKQHRIVNPDQIGLCGASQGGFLAAVVASGSRDIAFLINLYGMFVPVWQQELYSAGANMRMEDYSENEISEALALMELIFEVGRTGKGWEQLAALLDRSKDKNWFGYVPHFFSDLEELLYYWRTLYSYDPTIALNGVTCPVLSLFGDLDKSTPVPQTVENMAKVLREAGNQSFNFKIFQKGIHGLLEGKTGASSEIPYLKRFVPGLFETIEGWLREKGFMPS